MSALGEDAGRTRLDEKVGVAFQGTTACTLGNVYATYATSEVSFISSASALLGSQESRGASGGHRQVVRGSGTLGARLSAG